MATPNTFEDLGLDPRLLRSIVKKGWTAPTPVQAEAIPAALGGRDVVARARTGSGKTLAYLLPALHRVLEGGSSEGWQALVLVPTRELCEQVKNEALAIAMFCGVEIRATALGAEKTAAAAAAALSGAGQVVVATPGRIAEALRDGTLPAKTLQSSLRALVLDEADLLLSYGHGADVAAIAPHVPRKAQAMLCSATASKEMEELQALVLHEPLQLDLRAAAGAMDEEKEGKTPTLSHWYVEAAVGDKLLTTVTLLKLGMLRKKVLAFVNSIESAYRLRIVLERFGLKSVVLHAELPVNSRAHIIEQFNKGLYDYLVAADDVDAGKARKRKGERPAKGAKKDAEFGVTRGIDFKGVRTVLNVEMPASAEGYTHRAGRAGRAGTKGFCLSVLDGEDGDIRRQIEAGLAAAATSTSAPAGKPDGGSDSDSDAEEQEDAGGNVERGGLQEYNRLKSAAVEKLRYRVEDVVRGAGPMQVREARARDLRVELLNSSRLKERLEDSGTGAAEMDALRHDSGIGGGRHLPHLRQVPAYLRDAAGKKGASRKKRAVARSGAAAKKKRKLIVAADPLKADAFDAAPTRGQEVLTDMERRAEAAGKKDLKKRKKQERMLEKVGAVAAGNVRKKQAAKKAAQAKRVR